MWTFERKEVKDKAVAWCVEHEIEADPLGIVIALDALGLLNDPAVEQSVQRIGSHVCETVNPATNRCIECGAVQE